MITLLVLLLLATFLVSILLTELLRVFSSLIIKFVLNQKSFNEKFGLFLLSNAINSTTINSNAFICSKVVSTVCFASIQLSRTLRKKYFSNISKSN